MYTQLIENFIERESLPDSYGQDAKHYFVPLAERISNLILQSKLPVVVGINGAQGTGKSTLSRLLIQLLKAREFTIANFCIDDFYLCKKDRQELARAIHPLLITRGVPGTHDMDLLRQTLSELQAQQHNQSATVPRFDKALDDRAAASDWQKVSGVVDAIIFEGWCVAVTPQAEAALVDPINDLEAEEDRDCKWRKYVNSQLADQYQSAFDQIQFKVMLKAPSFEQVFEWRKLQEEKLKRISSQDAAGIMNEEQLQRFIQHYERLTRHCLQSLPEK